MRYKFTLKLTKVWHFNIFEELTGSPFGKYLKRNCDRFSMLLIFHGHSEIRWFSKRLTTHPWRRGLFMTSPVGHCSLGQETVAQRQRTCTRLQSTVPQKPCPWLWALEALFSSLERPFTCKHLLMNLLKYRIFQDYPPSNSTGVL